MNKNKTEEISALEFRPLTDKKEKKEIIQWLNNNCFLFSGISLPSDIKLNISEEKEERGQLYGPLSIESIGKSKDQDLCYFKANDPFFGDFRNRGIDLYIVRKGNAFSYINYLSKADFYKEGKVSTITPKGVKALKKTGVVPEIFCEGEPIIKEIDIWPIISFYRVSNDKFKFEHRITGQLITGSPFGEHICPAQIISIPREEIKKAFSKSDLFWSRLFQVMVEKNFVNKWRLWFQLSDKADTKLLSVLYLYFIGKLPLQLWRTKGVTVKSGDGCFKKPNTLVGEFEVSIKELTLFSGLTRKCVRELIEGGLRKKKKKDKVEIVYKKSMFERNKRLAELLKYDDISRKGESHDSTKIGYYNFSTPSLFYLLHWIELGGLFHSTQKYF